MPEEPFGEFPYGNDHGFLFVVAVVFPPEADVIVVARHNPAVADGYPVGISTQIADYLIGSPECFFDVYVPVFGIERLFELIRGAIDVGLAIRNTKCILVQEFGQSGDEDTSIDGSQCFYRDKELSVGMDPLGMVRV
jgi:hypothetical protein